MSGHSKWSKIKHKKAATDAKKSKEFSKIVRFITTESKKAGGDTNAPGLRVALEKARAANMPADNIERAIAKGRSGEGAAMDPVLYETYGPGGVAILIEGLTDSRNRTAAEMKHLLSTHGATLAAPGAAAWAFIKSAEGWTPATVVDLSDEDTDKLATLVDALEEHDDVQNIYTNAA